MPKVVFWGGKIDFDRDAQLGVLRLRRFWNFRSRAGWWSGRGTSAPSGCQSLARVSDLIHDQVAQTGCRLKLKAPDFLELF